MRNTHAFFVTGTGTDVGKTFVTASLLRSLLLMKKNAQAVKIIQTGCVENALLTSPLADTYHYRMATSDLTDRETAVCLHTYPLPSSPHLAMRECGKETTVRNLALEIRKYRAESPAEILLLETAGGVNVPINETEDMLDLMADLAYPVLVVSQNTLGTINHTDMTLTVLAHRYCPIHALIVNETRVAKDATESRIREENARIMESRLARLDEKAFFVSLPFGQKGLRENFAASAQLLTSLAETLLPLGEDGTVLLDRKHIWHPYSRIAKKGEEPEPLYAVARTERNRIELEDGRWLIDGMSSWWSAIHGYRHPHIMEALTTQSKVFPHVMFGGFTHKPAVRLAERITGLLPDPLTRVFFADSGSVSVEVAMKMALQYQYATGARERTRFLTPRGGYHGDTMGAMSVCDPENGMHHLFNDRLARQYFIPRPACRFDRPFTDEAMGPARECFAKHGHEICAVILEPVVQGAGGMWFYHPDYLRGMADLCREYGCLLIFDEIATGFGHTGKFFALEWADVCPDILCMGKALTGGTMTLAATVCTDRVAEGICRNNGVFMHGPTFMANPLACAVANASIDLMEDGEWKKRVGEIETTLTEHLAPCANLDSVQDVRVLGDIGVVQTREKVDTAHLTRFFTDHGVWLRPFNDLVYIMPPYCSPREDLVTLCTVIHDALVAEEEKKKAAIN